MKFFVLLFAACVCVAAAIDCAPPDSTCAQYNGFCAKLADQCPPSATAVPGVPCNAQLGGFNCLCCVHVATTTAPIVETQQAGSPTVTPTVAPTPAPAAASPSPLDPESPSGDESPSDDSSSSSSDESDSDEDSSESSDSDSHHAKRKHRRRKHKTDMGWFWNLFDNDGTSEDVSLFGLFFLAAASICCCCLVLGVYLFMRNSVASSENGGVYEPSAREFKGKRVAAPVAKKTPKSKLLDVAAHVQTTMDQICFEDDDDEDSATTKKWE